MGGAGDGRGQRRRPRRADRVAGGAELAALAPRRAVADGRADPPAHGRADARAAAAHAIAAAADNTTVLRAVAGAAATLRTALVRPVVAAVARSVTALDAALVGPIHAAVSRAVGATVDHHHLAVGDTNACTGECRQQQKKNVP